MPRTRFAFHLIVGFLVGAGSLTAQNVAEDVLKGKEIQGIEFKNYVGPHKVIESRVSIQGIGADLGRQMKVSGATHAEYGQKYRVLRIHDASSDKLSTDLIVLGPDAGVDNIRNLNWIVSAYLQQVFGYSAADADLLADFVTRYNAFYRGKMDYIKSAFIPAVADNVTAENAGIALSYTDWPGKTRLMIPLRDSLSKGLAGSINTEAISNKDIVKDMANQPDALDQRKKLADLKEGEIVQEQKAIVQAESKVPVAPTSTGTSSPSPTANPPAGTAPAPANTLASNGKSAAATGTPPAATPAAPTAPAALPLAQAKQQLAARDQALQAERQDIVKQETKTPAPNPVPAPAAPVKPAATVGFVKMNESSKTGQLWLVDPVANKVWKKSELNSIRENQAPAFGPGLLVIAGDTKVDNGVVRLVLLSKDDGSVLVTGADDVSPDSPLVIGGNQVLALTKAPGGWVLGAFDTGLKPLLKGTDLLSAGTAVVVTPAGLLVQSAAGSVVLLDSATLKKKSNTEG